MDDLSAFADESFDIVHQPVSTCYVPSIEKVYREVARVLRDGGLYISQHKQPTSLQVSDRDARDRYLIGIPYYHEGSLPGTTDKSYRESGTAEYLHRWEDLVGGMSRSGLMIEDLREPRRGKTDSPPGHFGHRGLFIPPYVRIKSRRRPRVETSPSLPSLWMPD